MTIALDVIKDTLIDSLKTLPFLFLAFLLLEALEHLSLIHISEPTRPY